MPRKKTQEEFIAEARAVHGDKFDYSKVEYINSQTKVVIICQQHGEFDQTPTAHIWQKQGCPCCAGRKTHTDNCLQTCHPDIAVQWHPERNEKTTPKDIVARSNTNFWWKCPEADDHVWEDSPDHRVRNKLRNPNSNGCPFCSCQRVCGSNSLAVVSPQIALEWHPTKNGDLTPSDIVSKSGIRVWWKCPVANDHEWKASPADRAGGHGCPCCNGIGRGQKVVESNCFATTHPHLLEKWDYDKNTIKPTEITAGSQVKVWWKCPVADDHEWEASVGYMSNSPDGCPCCYGIKVVKSNCLATNYPELAMEWHPTKNDDLTPFDVLGGGKKKVWWKCPVADDHEWDATPQNRINGSGCPHCASRAGEAILSNCLATLQPDIAELWHPTKNGDLTPYSVYPYSQTRAWWKCPVADDHEWEAMIGNVASGSGCPCCQNRKVVPSNCLSTTHPEFVKQWHPVKNAITPDDVTFGSSVKVWWQCEKHPEHIWKVSPNSRFGKREEPARSCPFCASKLVGEKNSFTQEQFVSICNSVHGDKYDYSKVKYTKSVDKITIICRKHGEFQQRSISHSRGAGCPICNESKGERAIRLYLKGKSVGYRPQYSFKRSEIARSRFDFATRYGVIEYHGRQHYTPASFGSKKEHADVRGLLKAMQRDLRKERWCNKHNIPLLAIPYWDFHRIPEILDAFLDGEEPVLSDPPELVVKYEPMRKKIMEWLISKKSEKMEIRCVDTSGGNNGQLATSKGSC